MKSGQRHDLRHFYAPPQYKGEWRCDTHPHSSNDARTNAIDSRMAEMAGKSTCWT